MFQWGSTLLQNYKLHDTDLVKGSGQLEAEASLCGRIHFKVTQDVTFG
jgi:hypothetical protein